jgi:catechol 2,3-dioxygenase-like lactoylglutathione lyase family enzyme
VSGNSEELRMTATFNHTIIAARDRNESARFYRELLQFAEPGVEIQMNHYAFLVDDDLFDRAYRRLRDRGIEHWADPQMRRPGETNTEHDGRGVYFKDPAGHGLELITRPYL